MGDLNPDYRLIAIFLLAALLGAVLMGWLG